MKRKEKPWKVIKLWRKFKLWFKYSFGSEHRLSQPVKIALRAWRKRPSYHKITVYKALKIGWLRFSKKGICVTAKGNKMKVNFP